MKRLFTGQPIRIEGTAVHVFWFRIGGGGIGRRGEAQPLGRNLEFLRYGTQDTVVLRATAALQTAHLGLVVAERGGDVLLRASL